MSEFRERVIQDLIANRVIVNTNHKLDTDTQVFFYENDKEISPWHG